jgi:hypothetical protein
MILYYNIEMKNLPLGIQTFSEIIEKNYLYIDKTRDIYNLLAQGGKYYFLSRPRRFGKSLTISTLYDLFSGNKELFNGLWIQDKIQWEKYPVIHIDFTTVAYETNELLKKSIEEKLEKFANQYNIQLTSINYKTRFAELMEKLASSTNRKVVILIDEYDKPIIDKINEPDIAYKNREILKEFYSILKSSDKYIKFVFLTGVSKFSKVSIFSGLNNLRDITLSLHFSTMLGYTEEEMLHYFKDRLDAFDKNVMNTIRKWYNGYSWDGRNFVYNPHSILSFFMEERFDNYWFDTGTPTFLIKSIKEKDIPISEFENIEADNMVFESYDIDNIELTSLLFQTGYLTVKKRTVIEDETTYHLSYPNKEVREAFLKHLLKDFTKKRLVSSLKILKKLKSSLHRSDLDTFFSTIKSLFSSIPYNMVVDREGYYHSIIYILLRLTGITIQGEPETNIGRIDAVAETEKHIYIMEFKIGTAEEALNQVKEKKYYEPFLTSDKSIILVGIGIDTGKRNITSYTSEPLSH